MEVAKQEIESVRHKLERMDNDEMEQIIQYAYTIIANRNNQRKKELWDNVVAAIAKYESEIDKINLFCRHCGEDCTIDEIGIDDLGNITIS